MKNKSAWHKYPKVAHIPWLPEGTHTVRIEEYIFKPKRTQLLVQMESGGGQYRTTAFYGTDSYGQVMDLRKRQISLSQMTVKVDDLGTHVVSAIPAELHRLRIAGRCIGWPQQ